MTAKPYWFAAVASQLPPEFENGVTLSEGFPENEDGPADDAQLSYVILARALASSEDDVALLVQEAVKGFGPIEVIRVANRIEAVVRRERRAADALEPGSAQVMLSFVGFKRGSSEAQSSALEIVKLATLRKWWQFW